MKITQHGSHPGIFFKKGKERIIKRNLIKEFSENIKTEKNNPQVLKILKFIGNN